MAYILDSIRSLAVSLRNVVRKPITVHYPMEQRPRAERFRTTSFALLLDEGGDERCIACKACERICPSQVITVELDRRESEVTGKKRGYAKTFTLDQNACIFCELCVQVCPEDALVMARTPSAPAFGRPSLCLQKDELYENGKNGPVCWANASRLAAMQALPPAQTTTKLDPG